MFIRKDNTLRWKWIVFGALITLALVLLGILFFDMPLFNAINNPSCNTDVPDTTNGLCVAALLFGKIFNWKVLLGFAAISVLVFFIYKAVKLLKENIE